MPKPVTPSNPSAALVNLSLDAVALCNEGANSRAHIIFTKRKENSNMPTNLEALLKALNDDQAKIITDHIDALEATKDGVIKGLNEQIATLTGKVETLEKSKPAGAAEEGDILKNASPEIKALVEKMQSSMSALVAQQEEALAKSRYEAVKALPVEEGELKSVLKSASPAVFAILEKAAAAVAKGLEPKGRDTGNQFTDDSADSAYAKLEKSAKTISAEKGISFEKAFTMACQNDPETYKNYVKGV